MAGGCSLDLQPVPEMVDEMSDFTAEVGLDCPSKKLCVECGTSKTPLWRSGPAGPKSLCNACGIRSRKKRWALLQMSNAKEKNSEKKMKHVVLETNKTNGSNNSCYNNSSSSNENSSDSSSEDRLMAMWEVVKPRNVRVEELSEEQQAAVLLMALSHGLNYN